ncbi:MAG: ribosome maturation factor RimP [Thiovulaceae bacterium]|nr:ribosome maturation factor RimP [Sulfurimonadaceae bacterium]
MGLEQDIEAMVRSQGLTLYDTSITSHNGDTIFEVLVTSPTGASLDQCAEISKLLSPLLDVTPPVKDEYRLEVGTPGIERKLKTIEHFQKSIGELVKVTLINGEHAKGKLLSVEGDALTIDDENGEVTLPYSEVLKARTYFEW